MKSARVCFPVVQRKNLIAVGFNKSEPPSLSSYRQPLWAGQFEQEIATKQFEQVVAA
jgi:hypothetical protein